MLSQDGVQYINVISHCLYGNCSSIVCITYFYCILLSHADNIHLCFLLDRKLTYDSLAGFAVVASTLQPPSARTVNIL